VLTTVDRHKLLAGRFDGVEVISSQRSRSRKVFSSLNEEHRNREPKAEILRPAGLRLGDESFGAQHLAITGIIDVLHGITASDEPRDTQNRNVTRRDPTPRLTLPPGALSRSPPYFPELTEEY
jgi:hypothetical protein